MKSLLFAAALSLCGSAFAQQLTSSSAYHVGKLSLITPHHAYDWQGHYSSANGSVDVYCDSTTYETNCTDSPASAHYEVELEEESNTEHRPHSLSPVAVFVDGKQIKLDFDGFGNIDEDYDPVARGKEQLSKQERDRPVSERITPGATVTGLTFEYRVGTVRPRTPRDSWERKKDIKDVDVYCVPFKLKETKKKKEIEKSVETCYQLYMFQR